MPDETVASQLGIGQFDRPPGPRRWCLLFYAAMGLGFLCKGPIVLLLVGMTVVPYLATTGRLVTGARRLIDGRGCSCSPHWRFAGPFPCS